MQIFFWYLFRKFFKSFFILLIIFSAIISLVDFLELLRRAEGKDVTSLIIVQMTLFKLPAALPDLIYFLVTIATINVIAKLDNHSELIVMRINGLTLAHIAAPFILATIIISVFFVTIFTYFIGKSEHRFMQLENIHLNYYDKNANNLFLGKRGLWVRQLNQDKIQYFARFQNVRKDTLTFENTHFVELDENEQFKNLILAKEAQYNPDKWQLSNVELINKKHGKRELENYEIANNIEQDFLVNNIENNHNEVKTLSFWQLPKITAILESAGFKALRHKTYFHSLLAMPLLLMSMVMLAMIFAVNPPRFHKIRLNYIFTIASAFGVYAFKSIFELYGNSGNLNVYFAVWSPMLMLFFGSFYLMSNKELK